MTIIITISEVPKWLPALISGLVTVATAATNFYKFGEHGIDFYLTSEEMQQEYNWFVTGRSQYKNLNSDETFGLFMDRIENLMRSHTQRPFALEKPGEDQSKDPRSKGNRNTR